MIERIASTIEMSFDIPASEKETATETVKVFKQVISNLDLAKNHLNIIYEPFKDNAEPIPVEAVEEFRGAVFKFKEQIKRNFEKVKITAHSAISNLNNFSSDTHINELINTFRDSISDVEKQVNILSDILDDLRTEEFKDAVVKAVESIRQAVYETENLIKDRILEYINTNILAKDWVTDTSDELKTEIKSKIPYTTQLFQERQKALNLV